MACSSLCRVTVPPSLELATSRMVQKIAKRVDFPGSIAGSFSVDGDDDSQLDGVQVE